MKNWKETKLKYGFTNYQKAFEDAELGETLFYSTTNGWYFKRVEYGYRCQKDEFKVDHYYINANNNIRSIRKTRTCYENFRLLVLEQIEEYTNYNNSL